MSRGVNPSVDSFVLKNSGAKFPPNPNLVEAPPGSNVLELYEGLKKAGSWLAI